MRSLLFLFPLELANANRRMTAKVERGCMQAVESPCCFSHGKSIKLLSRNMESKNLVSLRNKFEKIRNLAR